MLGFELLAGTRPFAGAPADAAYAMLSRPAPALTSVAPSPPRWLSELLAIAIAREAGDRFANGSALGAALDAG